MARRSSASRAASCSARSDFRNLRRAGVAKNRSRTSTRVPNAPAAGAGDAASTGLDVERKGVLLATRPADDAQPAHAGERGQRLAAKAEQGDPDQLVVVELGGGVALHRQRQLVRRDAAAIVGDRDQRSPAAAQLHRDPRRPGIDRVLDQLLDRGRRPLDHLTGGDPVDHAWRQGADGWHWCSAGRRRLATGSMPGRRSSGKMLPAPPCSSGRWTEFACPRP